jgi:hypothetical protein
VEAEGLGGLINENVPNPTHHFFGSGRVFHDFANSDQFWIVYSYENDRPAGLPRNTLHGRGLINLDISVAHAFVLSKARKEARTLTVSLDSFNVVNHKNDATYVGIIPSPFFGRASVLDLDLSVRFKTVSGSIDRAAGLVFRLKDANNYYIVRANALENNYRLYHVVNGRRSQFDDSRLPRENGTSCTWRPSATRSLATTTAARKLRPLTKPSRTRGKLAFGPRRIPSPRSMI